MRTFVVTGGGRGIGLGIVERLLAEGATVVALELDPAALERFSGHPAGERIVPLAGSAADEATAERAADLAERAGPLTGWVNNAAVFRDASVHSHPAAEVLDRITGSLAPAVVGSAVAVRRMLAHGGGSIVNLSSHQARTAVPGALPYATAKAAIEGLTRALAVEYGPRGIRVNAVAPGSVRTDRLDAHLAALPPERADAVRAQLAAVHPLGRPATVEEVAGAVAFLLSPDAAFVNGATLPVDGGRTVLAHDPEAI